MSEKRQVFRIPTQEIYLVGSGLEVEVGKLAVIGFIDREFILPSAYREDETKTQAWPTLLLEITDEEPANPEVYEVYRLVPNYAKNNKEWHLHHGWETLVEDDEHMPHLWSGAQDAYFWPSARAYDQKKLELAVDHAMRNPWKFKS